MWNDPETLYRLSNAATAAGHVALAALPLHYLRRHRTGRVLRQLAPPLAALFITAVVSHAIQAATGCGVPAFKSLWFAARSLVVLACVPWTWHGLRSLSFLPTKEEWERAIADKDAALVREREARGSAEQSAAREAKLRAVAERTAAAIAQSGQEMRAEIEHLKGQVGNERMYQALRQKYHEISDAASGLPRVPADRG